MRKFIGKMLVTLFLLSIVYVSYVAISIWSYHYPEEPRHADAAIVLGAAAWGENPSPVFTERIRHGIWLYQNGYVDTLIFTGGKSEGAELSESEAARRYALRQGVPTSAILIEEESRTTQGNMYYAAKIVQAHGFQTVLIVSDPLHMKRALLMAKDDGLIAYPSPTPTTKYRTLETQLPFLAREVMIYIGYRIVHLRVF